MRNLFKAPGITIFIVVSAAACSLLSSADGSEINQGVAAIDGELDCDFDSGSWGVQAGFDDTIPGAPDPIREIEDVLRPYQEEYSLGDVEHIQDGVGSLVSERGEVVLAQLGQTTQGGWVLSSLSGCNEYEHIPFLS